MDTSCKYCKLGKLNVEEIIGFSKEVSGTPRQEVRETYRESIDKISITKNFLEEVFKNAE